MAHHLRCSRATALPGSHLTPRGEVAGRDVPAFFEWLFCAIEHRGWVQRCTLAFCHRANRVMRQWVSDDVAVIVSTYPLARPGTGPAQGDRPDPATRCHLPHRPRRPPTMGAPVPAVERQYGRDVVPFGERNHAGISSPKGKAGVPREAAITALLRICLASGV